MGDVTGSVAAGGPLGVILRMALYCATNTLPVLSTATPVGLLKLAEPSRRNPALEGGYGAAPGEAFSFLTEREIEILSALNAGESNKEIARTLRLAPETGKWHLKNVRRKLRAGSRG